MIEVIAWDVVVSVMACIIICFIFDLCAVRVPDGFEAYGVHVHTSKASIRSEAACFEGADRLFCADIKFMRSQTCWSVGALVTDARCSGNRVPGGSVHPSLAFDWQTHGTKSYQSSQEPTQPLVPGISRPGNLEEVGVCSVHHLRMS